MGAKQGKAERWRGVGDFCSRQAVPLCVSLSSLSQCLDNPKSISTCRKREKEGEKEEEGEKEVAKEGEKEGEKGGVAE